jgi:hypothetical protein
MSKFVIIKNDNKNDTVNRTIRFKGSLYDKLLELSEKNDITFNKIVNQCIEYALDNLDE